MTIDITFKGTVRALWKWFKALLIVLFLMSYYGIFSLITDLRKAGAEAEGRAFLLEIRVEKLEKDQQLTTDYIEYLRQSLNRQDTKQQSAINLLAKEHGVEFPFNK